MQRKKEASEKYIHTQENAYNACYKFYDFYLYQCSCH